MDTDDYPECSTYMLIVLIVFNTSLWLSVFCVAFPCMRRYGFVCFEKKTTATTNASVQCVMDLSRVVVVLHPNDVPSVSYSNSLLRTGETTLGRATALRVD